MILSKKYAISTAGQTRSSPITKKPSKHTATAYPEGIRKRRKQLNRFPDFIRFEAGTADLVFFDNASILGAHFVQIGEKTALGSVHCVASVITELRSFTTYITYS